METQVTWNEIKQKFLHLITSRKFWALVGSLVVVAQRLALGEIDGFQAAILSITAFSVYTGFSAIEDAAARRA